MTFRFILAWVGRHPRDIGKAVCRFCQSVIRAHKNDLLEHSRTLKHQRNFMQNASPEEYDEFISNLRKETKKRPSSATTTTFPTSESSPVYLSRPNNNNNNIKYDQQATITIIAAPSTGTKTLTNGIVNNPPLTCNNPLNNGCTVIQTTNAIMGNLPPSSIPSFNPSNTVSVEANGISASSIPTFINLTTATDQNPGETLTQQEVETFWQDNEEFITGEANSPRDLVSVILEEQQSPLSNSSKSNNATRGTKTTLHLTNGHGHEEPVRSDMQNVILSTTEITDLSMNFNVLSGAASTTSVNGHVQEATNLTSDPCPSIITSHQGENTNISYEILAKPGQPLQFAYSDVITAIEEGHFSFSELCSIAKTATFQIDRLINGLFPRVTANTNGMTLCPTNTADLTYTSTNLNPATTDIISSNPKQLSGAISNTYTLKSSN